MADKKLEEVKTLVAEYKDLTGGQIEDFIDGGDEGWECGDDEHQAWLDTASADEIANWVIAGN